MTRAVGWRAVCAVLLLAGCANTTPSTGANTLTGELLISAAIDSAAAQLQLALPKTGRILLVIGGGDDALRPYLAGVLKSAFLRHGYALAATRSHADVVVEVAVGAMGVAQQGRRVGIPSVPLGAIGSLPALPLYGSRSVDGVVKLALVAYDARTGTLLAAPNPIFGSASLYDSRLAGGLTLDREIHAPPGDRSSLAR